MEMNSSFESREDHLVFRIQGPFDMESLGAVIDRLIDTVAQTQALNVLVDVTEVTGEPNVWQRFQFATLFGGRFLAARAQDRIPVSRFALWGKEPLLDPKRLGEKVAQNRGLPVKVFTSQAEAMEWLRS
jgi:hypothetical protein